MKLGHVEVHGAGIAVHAWASGVGLAAVRVGEVPAAAAQGPVPVEGIELGEAEPGLVELARALQRYLEGHPLDWSGPLDVRGIPAFDLEVLEAVRRIPFGETRTYGQVARDIGRPLAVRAVGAALSRNPFPIVVPCHRVLREGGKLGGYACGTEAKLRLLELEAGQTELPLPEAIR
jgi:methylated-DNA-[protein]-cysteine S-methyltransferase